MEETGNPFMEDAAENDHPNKDGPAGADQAVFPSRLKAAVKRAGGVPQVSRRSGVPESTLNKWLAGTSEPGAFGLTKVAEATSSSLDYLVGHPSRFGSPLPPEELVTDFKGLRKRAPSVDLVAPSLPEGFVAIPRLDIRASAGPGRAAVPSAPSAEPQIALRGSWLRSLGVTPGNGQFLEAEGDSMEDTICNGDLLLVNRAEQQPRHGYIYVFVVAGLVVVKRVHLLFDGSIVLSSDNDRYPSETVRPDRAHELTTEGRVVWYGRAI